MAAAERNARTAGIQHLAAEFGKVGAAFVEHPGIFDKRGVVARFHYPHREVHILSEAHRGKPAHLPEHIRTHGHIEGTREETGYLALASAYAAGCEEGGHRIAYRFLHRGEVGTGAVRPAEGRVIALPVLPDRAETTLDGAEPAGRDYGIRVEKYEPLPFRRLRTEVSCRSGPCVFFFEISHRLDRFIAFDYSFARLGGTVFYHYDFIFLPARAETAEAVQKFGNLFGTVVNGDNDGIFHYSNSMLVKNSGLWKSGWAVAIGAKLRKCGVLSKSPHL